MNNLQTLKNRIVAVVPEIMELKFGCELYHGIATFYLDMNRNGEIWVLQDNQVKLKNWFIKDIQILGRPITLADVLRAIGNMLIIVDSEGNFYKMQMKLSDKLPKLGSHLGTWDLTKDLDGQSEDTIEFLLEIIPEK